MTNSVLSHSLLSPNHIIVRMPNWLGDLVMATPILADLRHRWPLAKITAMCQGTLGSVLQEDPNVNTVFTFKRPRGWFDKQSMDNILTPIQKEQYDLGVLLTNSFSSAYWFWRGKIPYRIGYATHARNFLLTHPIPFPPEKESQHLVVTYKMLLNSLSIPISPSAPRLYLTSQEQQNAREKLAAYGVEKKDFIIGINPGAAYGSAKCWLPERFKELSKRLLNFPHLKIVFLGDKMGAPLVKEICKDLPDRVINLAGTTTLRELIAFIQTCHLFLTNDSGPMHVASALGVPLLALFGSTSDTTTGPYAKGQVIHKHVPCSPCYRRECPLIDFRCMKAITVDEVFKEIHSYLDEVTK